MVNAAAGNELTAKRQQRKSSFKPAPGGPYMASVNATATVILTMA